MDDRSGLMTFSLGLTIIVLTSVALSMAVEKRFLFSDNKGELEKEIEIEKEEIRFLRATVTQASLRYQSSIFGVNDRTARDKLVAAKRSALKERRESLLRRKAEAEAGIEAIKNQQDQYRSDYRKVTWRKAIGEQLPQLRTLDGQQYRQVVISKITGSGLEVRHASGYAHILSTDLDDAWQERFQWDRK